ncbi:MAG: outer membrane lipoprotein-sorting protein, partial [Candidatus Rokubacteria bacterium]|nr:outer membrane lipoprotein-sorting protein [Candidatus Rokubacteria bacterium]
LLALADGAAAQDASDIVAKADQARRPGEAFIWKATITSYEGTKAPTVNVYEVYVKGTAKSLVRFVAPARDVGRSLLALDRDLWIYLPEAGKPVRIPMSQRLVGQVANGDIARTNYAGDYAPKLSGTEAVDGVPCYVLDLAATSKDVTYAAIKYWVGREGLRPVKAEFYAGTGTLLKTGTFDGYREFEGRTLATRLTLMDAIRKDKKSVIEFSELRVRDIPDKLFNKNSMKSLD